MDCSRIGRWREWGKARLESLTPAPAKVSQQRQASCRRQHLSGNNCIFPVCSFRVLHLHFTTLRPPGETSSHCDSPSDPLKNIKALLVTASSSPWRPSPTKNPRPCRCQTFPLTYPSTTRMQTQNGKLIPATHAVARR